MKKNLLATMLVMLIILSILHVFLSTQEANIETSIEALQHRIDRYQVKSPLRVLKSSPIKYVNKPLSSLSALFYELEKMNDAAVCFTEIVQDNHSTSFRGSTRSASDLTNYLKNWRAAYLFSQININRLDQQHHSIAQFRFTAFM